MSDAYYKAIVKETGDGEPYIVFELIRGDPSSVGLEDSMIGLTFKVGTNIQDVQDIANTINTKVKNPFQSKY